MNDVFHNKKENHLKFRMNEVQEVTKLNLRTLYVME